MRVRSSLKAETKTVLHCLIYCYLNLIQPLLFETDSLGLTKIIQREWRISWTIRENSILHAEHSSQHTTHL